MFPLNWAFAEPAKNNMAARNPRDHDKDNLTLIFFLYPPLDPKQAFSERPSKAVSSVNVFLQVPGLYAVGNGAVKQILFCIQSKSLGSPSPNKDRRRRQAWAWCSRANFPRCKMQYRTSLDLAGSGSGRLRLIALDQLIAAALALFSSGLFAGRSQALEQLRDLFVVASLL
jgi:hypothetical protein